MLRNKGKQPTIGIQSVKYTTPEFDMYEIDYLCD